MKKSRALVMSIVALSMLSATGAAFAEKKDNGPEIANEANWDAAPAPANYDADLKSKNDKAEKGAEGITTDANPIVVLDPGHGGSDPGAVGNGLREADLTLDIANRTRSYMSANYGFTPYQTRTSDTTVSLDARASFANSKGANIFTSMHINSYSGSTANGLEVYHYPGSTTGYNLASAVYNKLKASYTTLRGIKTAEFYVLKYTNMPAILGETGFISNPTDAGKLGTTTFRQSLATQYAQGMHVYWWGF